MDVDPTTGFRLLPEHSSEHEDRHLHTEYQRTYGRVGRASLAESTALRRADAPFAGAAAPPSADGSSGGKSTSGAVGEQVKAGADPKESTLCQRSWMYGGDPALEALSSGSAAAAVAAAGDPMAASYMSLQLKGSASTKPGPRVISSITRTDPAKAKGVWMDYDGK